MFYRTWSCKSCGLPSPIRISEIGVTISFWEIKTISGKQVNFQIILHYEIVALDYNESCISVLGN